MQTLPRPSVVRLLAAPHWTETLACPLPALHAWFWPAELHYSQYCRVGLPGLIPTWGGPALFGPTRPAVQPPRYCPVGPPPVPFLKTASDQLLTASTPGFMT